MNSFLVEFRKLLLESPRYNVKQVNAENCGFADTAVKSKNCYYSFCVFYCEDVYYSRYSRQCSHSSDLAFCVGCEWCVECIDCVQGYLVFRSKHCANCSECVYCLDCYGCESCFGCVGLYRKKYHFFNEALTKAEYEKRIAALDISKQEDRKTVEQRLRELRKTAMHLGIHQNRTEHCIGDNLTESKGCYQCYDAFKMEDCFYNIECNGNKDCCDMTVCFEAEQCYSCVQAPMNYDSRFLLHTDLCNDSEFCAFSKGLKNCFGCVYLSHKEHHILNKPYSPEEYVFQVEKIKRQLKDDGLYNMMIYFVSDYEKNRWREEEDSAIQTQLPDNPSLTSYFYDMKNPPTPLVCKHCHKEFLVIPQEKKLYDLKKMPMPDFCPACRHRQRMALRNERKLYSRTCIKCGEAMFSTYPQEAPYKVYCQKCFWENIS